MKEKQKNKEKETRQLSLFEKALGITVALLIIKLGPVLLEHGEKCRREAYR
jgi:hypothetical protein